LTYQHTQHGRIHYLLAPFGAGAIVGSVLLLDRGEPYPAVAVGLVGLLMLVAALSFARLSVREEGDRLAVRFGPIGLARTSVRYGAIRSFRRGRSSLVDGLGIHWLPGRGWIWNLSGFDCVELEVEGRGRLRIGTDDPDGLVRHLEERVGGT